MGKSRKTSDRQMSQKALMREWRWHVQEIARNLHYYPNERIPIPPSSHH